MDKKRKEKKTKQKKKKKKEKKELRLNNTHGIFNYPKTCKWKIICMQTCVGG